MEITPTGVAATTGATAVKPAAEEKQESAGVLAADFQTFLTLLTTQMRNQDPLKPMESTEFIAQLATFSGVEQQVRTNDRLDSMLEALGGGSAGLAEWIGREVRAPGKAAFSGEPVDIGVTPLDGADKATLIVRNDFGQEVARFDVDPKAETVTWDGSDDMGKPSAHGSYGFEVESFTGETPLGTQQGSVYSAVKEVRIVDGDQTLVLADGSRIGIDQVTGVRAAATP